jgi:hypothetical protein
VHDFVGERDDQKPNVSAEQAYYTHQDQKWAADFGRDQTQEQEDKEDSTEASENNK